MLLSVLCCKQLTESKGTMIVEFCPFTANKPLSPIIQSEIEKLMQVEAS